MQALLTVQQLTAGYGDRNVIHDISLQVDRGSVVCLLGANGAGKTTVLRAITGMIRRHAAMHFDGQDISTLSTEKISRLGVAHVPDGRGTFTQLSVDENLRIGAYGLRSSSDQQDIRNRVLKLFPRLRERIDQQAGTLSGGEQQMLAIGRALMQKPLLMLLDEPSFGLAPLVIKEVLAALREVTTELGTSILMVEQNASLALEMSQYAYVLESGRIALEGTADAIAANDGVRAAYLGAH